jgi:catechol 2,3-dioxygenase-like lactoylglutathione lyase family enzyme
MMDECTGMGNNLAVMRTAIAIGALLMALVDPAFAQLAAPNQAGVAMGHLHYRVRDVEANARFWERLGGTRIRVGESDAIRFTDVLVVLTKGDYAGLSEGVVVNHIAFRVPSFTALEARGIAVQRMAQFPGVANTTTPEGERVELFEDAALNLTFTPDDGRHASGSDRHNRPVGVPIAFHHVHLYVPGEQHLEARAWYVRMFGAIPGKRAQYDAADLPGINLNFSGGRTSAPMKGRTLEHIGFEVRDLEAFCRRLASMGVTFDVPFRKAPDGVSIAVLTDPWGTSIELTEGLRAF